MSERIQLRLTIPSVSELYEHLSGRNTTEQKYELLMLATNGLRFQENIKQIGTQQAKLETVSVQEQKAPAQPTVKDESDETEPSFVNVGNDLSEYID